MVPGDGERAFVDAFRMPFSAEMRIQRFWLRVRLVNLSLFGASNVELRCQDPAESLPAGAHAGVDGL